MVVAHQCVSIKFIGRDKFRITVEKFVLQKMRSKQWTPLLRNLRAKMQNIKIKTCHLFLSKYHILQHLFM